MRLNFEHIPSSHHSILQVFYHDLENPCTVLWHYHPEFELVYVPHGNGTRRIGDHSARYADGDLVLIAPNVPHLNFNYPQRVDHEEIVIQFQMDRLSAALKAFPEFNSLREWLCKIGTGVSFSTAVRNKLDQLLRSLTSMPPATRMVTFLDILNQLYTAPDPYYLEKLLTRKTDNQHDGERLNSVYAYVKENYHAAVDIGQVVALSGLSHPAFCRFFKRTTRMSFTAFLNEFRVDKACERLKQGDSVADAAYAVGFNSISHFNVTFKRIVQVTPTAYRKQFTGR